MLPRSVRRRAPGQNHLLSNELRQMTERLKRRNPRWRRSVTLRPFSSCPIPSVLSSASQQNLEVLKKFRSLPSPARIQQPQADTKTSRDTDTDTVARADEAIQGLTRTFEHDGAAVLEHAYRMGSRGSFRALGLRYQIGPSKTWRKSKNPLSEAVRRER